jgi:hypothetical protein
MLTWPTKSPGEVLDYAVDWSVPLAGDTIQTSTWIVPASITKTKDGQAGNVCTIWLSGGSMNDRILIINRVATVGGRTIEQHVKLRIGLK